MKAIFHTKYGAPTDVLKLKDTEVPVPGDGEILVKVIAAGVQAGDWVITRGWPYIARPMYGLLAPKNKIAGFDLSGIVEAVGPRVEEFRPGDEVFGTADGSFAEFVSGKAENFAHKPPGIDFEQAAVVSSSAMTALQAIHTHAAMQAGHKVLIIGASGGVGTFAVQMASNLGAEVTGVCSSTNIEMVKSLGAAYVIDYTATDLKSHAKKYDIILDLAGNRNLKLHRQLLSPDGTAFLLGGRGGRWFMGMGRTIKALILSAFIKQNFRFFVAVANQKDLEQIREMLANGKLKSVIDKTYKLESTPQAISYVEKGHARGKVVIAIS